MILKGSQRAGATQLAIHLLNDRDNDHVRVHELRGFAADDLHGAFTEAHAISRGTKCTQFLFSLSLNPPKGALTGEDDFTRAADEAEKRLGLTGQPRAIVIHEKEGRRHAHVVWSRIDAEEMRAVNLPHFKRKLTALSRDLYFDHGWTLLDGLRTNGGRNPLNFTLEEWQHAKRLGRDPREIKDALRNACARTDSLSALAPALERRGYHLARGDRRGLVVVDTDGEIYALGRWAGLKARELRDRFGDGDALPSVEVVKADVARRMTAQLKTHLTAFRLRQAQELTRERGHIAKLTQEHRAERLRLERTQAARWAQETRDRSARLRCGLAGLWDSVTGRKRVIRADNEREAIVGLTRDRAERDDLSVAQRSERAPLQDRLDRLRARHTHERALMARDVTAQRRGFRTAPADDRAPEPARPRRRNTPSLDLLLYGDTECSHGSNATGRASPWPSPCR